MRKSAKYLFALFCSAIVTSATAQDAEMADTFRADGKIYVVVAIVLVVLSGLVTYLFLLDRKMTRLEKMFDPKKQTKAEGKTF